MRRPITILGLRMEICHVLPAMVSMAILASASWAAFATISHWIPPVQLTSIWLERLEGAHMPAVFTSDEVAAGKAVFRLKKSGKWRRECAIDARQTYLDEKGTIRISGELHPVEVPKPESEGTTMTGKPRKEPDVIPKILASSPGKWRIRLVNINGACWWWERIVPIVPSEPVEATFEIVAR